MREKISKFFASYWGIILVGPSLAFWACFAVSGQSPNMGIVWLVLNATSPVRLVCIVPESFNIFVPKSLVSFWAQPLQLCFSANQSRAGSAPIVRFVLGVFAMIGALVFLGCPWRRFPSCRW